MYSLYSYFDKAKFGSFFDDISHYYLLENQISLINYTRDYNISKRTMNVVLSTLIDKEYRADYKDALLSDLFDMFYIYFKDFFAILSNIDKNLVQSYKFIYDSIDGNNNLTLSEKINQFIKLFNQCNKISSHSFNFPYDEKNESIELKNEEIDKIFVYLKVYDLLLKLFSEICERKHDKSKVNNLANIDIIATEFHMFFTHFTFAYYASKFEEMEQGSCKEYIKKIFPVQLHILKEQF